MHPPRIADVLRNAWGRNFRGLHEWPVEAEGVPHSLDGVRALIEAAPERALELIQCQGAPEDPMPPLTIPRDRAALLDPRAVRFELTGGRPFVLRAGNLAAWHAPAEDWCRRFAQWVKEEMGSVAERVLDVRSDVYVVGARGITAFHADPSHNFTLQVCGRREIHAFSNTDPRLVDNETRARIYLTRGRFPVYRAECEDRADRFALAPGNCSYLPPLTAHWIQNGDELAISYVVSVRTRAEIREKLVHGMNARLRAIGWHPANFGAHAGRDDLKASVEGSLRRAGRWLERAVLRRAPEPYQEPLSVRNGAGRASHPRAQ